MQRTESSQNKHKQAVTEEEEDEEEEEEEDGGGGDDEAGCNEGVEALRTESPQTNMIRWSLKKGMMMS